MGEDLRKKFMKSHLFIGTNKKRQYRLFHIDPSTEGKKFSVTKFGGKWKYNYNRITPSNNYNDVLTYMGEGNSTDVHGLVFLGNERKNLLAAVNPKKPKQTKKQIQAKKSALDLMSKLGDTQWTPKRLTQMLQNCL